MDLRRVVVVQHSRGYCAKAAVLTYCYPLMGSHIRYRALAADPRTYRFIAAVRMVDFDFWITQRSK